MSKEEQLKIIQDSIDLIDSMSKEEFLEFIKSKGHQIKETDTNYLINAGNSSNFSATVGNSNNFSAKMPYNKAA